VKADAAWCAGDKALLIIRTLRPPDADGGSLSERRTSAPLMTAKASGARQLLVLHSEGRPSWRAHELAVLGREGHGHGQHWRAVPREPGADRRRVSGAIYHRALNSRKAY
jgi:hypothetical protein